ncbi:MAG: TetR/AcrR family transcriptional regulator [Desulfobulbaceae bacterium]|nr:MAG: TetR/AcrR family transcriptional regulator [Desulfobulbaceae bacterium]
MKNLDKHDKIISAAIKVFAKKGFFNARISDIAKEAKVADGTIYLYFNNKFDILVSVFEEEIGKIIAQIELSLSSETDPQKKLEIFARHHLTAMKRNKNLAEVIQIELRQSNKVVRDYRNTAFQRYINLISEIINEGQSTGVFRKDIMPGIAKRALFGALDEVTRVWTSASDTSYTLEETIDQLYQIFISGLKIRS